MWRYALAILCGAGFWMAAFYSNGDWNFRPFLAVDLLIGVVSIVLLRWRRSHPLVVALLVGGVGGLATAASGAVVVAAVSVATRRRWREIVPVVVVNIV